MEASFQCQLDSRYVEDTKANHIPLGIFKLARAALILSLEDLFKGKNRETALVWLFSDNNKYVFSFLSVCVILYLDQTKIRGCIDDTDYLSSFLAEYKKAQQYGHYFNVLFCAQHIKLFFFFLGGGVIQGYYLRIL